MMFTLVRRFRLPIVAAIAVTAGLVGPVTQVQASDPPAFPSATAAAQVAIDAAAAQGAVDSMTIGITDAQGLLWTGTAGRIDAGGGLPDASTMYGIGSVSKMFTTAAVMQLVDQGKVGLDQPVAKYVPDFTMLSPQYRQITVRMLLNHTAGFPGSDYANGWTTRPFTGYAEQAMDALAHSTLKTTPGALAVYCNDCFTVAGQVVAAVSGMPFTTYVERNILAPLGMQHSTYITKKVPAPGTVARIFNGPRMLPMEITNIYASGGLLSTPTDMGAFARMFLNKGATAGTRILLPQSVAQMGRDQIATTLQPVADPLLVFGLGWDTVSDALLRFEGIRAWGKNGSTIGYHANFLVAPDQGLAVFAAAAGEQEGIDGVVGAISHRLMQDALKERGDIGPRDLMVTVPALAAPSEDDVNAMLGIYLASAGGSMRVTPTAQAGVLQLSQLVGGTWVPAEEVAFRADGQWWPTSGATHSWRSATGWGRTYLVQVAHSGDKSTSITVAQRVAASGPTAKAWDERIGLWLVVNDLPDSLTWRAPIGALTRIPGLPGYLEMSGAPLAAQGEVGTMFAQVPMNNGRDQDDLVPLPGGLLRRGYSVMRPAATVPALTKATTTLTIGSTGYAEWTRVPRPAAVTVDGATAWYLYDKDGVLLGSGTTKPRTLRAGAGSWLVVLGDPGDAISVALE